MNILEKEIEELVVKCFESTNPDLYGFGSYYGKRVILRQFNLPGYGVADLITVGYGRNFDGICIFITVYELKKEEINVNTLMQVCRYIKGIKRYIDKLPIRVSNKERIKANISGVMIGKRIETKGDFIYLMDGVNNVTAKLYSLDIDSGLYFYTEEFDYFSSSESSVDIKSIDLLKLKSNFNESESTKEARAFKQYNKEDAGVE